MGKTKKSRPDLCSVDFSCITPKFRFEFCCGFLLGKRNHTPPCSIYRKNGGPQRKDFGGGHGFPGFFRVFVPPPAWKVFLRGQKSSPNDFLSVVIVYAFCFLVSRGFSSFFPRKKGLPKSTKKNQGKTKGQNRFIIFTSFALFTLFQNFPPGLSPSKQRALA